MDHSLRFLLRHRPPGVDRASRLSRFRGKDAGGWPSGAAENGFPLSRNEAVGRPGDDGKWITRYARSFGATLRAFRAPGACPLSRE